MKIKIIEKRNIFVGLFFIFYFFVFIALFSPVVEFIEKNIFKYEKPNDFGYLDFIPPAKVVVGSTIIYLSVAIILYLFILRLIKVKNE